MPVWTSFLIAFSVLLPLMNPLGAALVFLGLAGEAPVAVYRSLTRKIAKVIPPANAHGILRVIAFILLCIGVQIAWNGLFVLLTTIVRP